jgi:DNA-binding Xre family transcriptional regulator
MLKLNIARVLHLRGIYDTNEYLRGLGYSRNKVIRLAKDQLESFNRYDMERICLDLNCTPNDLLEWRPSQKMNVDDDHALRALERRKAALGVVELVQGLPVEEVEAVERFILERKKRVASAHQL